MKPCGKCQTKGGTMERRTFLKLSGVSVLAMLTQARAEYTDSSQKPNILIIMTDQQFADAMSCAMGRKYIHTPHMDSLAESGVRFTRAYAPNPRCVPMRTSLFTGRYPHQTGVQTNSSRLDPAGFVFMGKIFKDFGYETAYFGKWHVPVSFKKKEVHGFDTFLQKEALLDPGPAVEFLKQPRDRPFLAVASFLGPHEVCEWARKEKIPGEQLPDPPPLEKLPPLKTNFDPPTNETDIMAHMRKSFQAHRQYFPVRDYTEYDWRRLIWGYYRLIERVDGHVGAVLNALRESGLEENTLVLFLSDHGECHGAHHWNKKSVFYDEAARVPFIMTWKDTIPQGTSSMLINTGIDVIPTLCDFAGIDAPADLPGNSLKALIFGRMPDWKREYIISQTHLVQGVPVDGKNLRPHGRMVRSDRYKYCVYSEGLRRESLVDMEKDPGEMVNQAGNSDFKDILNQHRAFLKEFAERHKDRIALEMLRSLEE